jgi:hypothetical protein
VLLEGIACVIRKRTRGYLNGHRLQRAQAPFQGQGGGVSPDWLADVMLFQQLACPPVPQLPQL